MYLPIILVGYLYISPHPLNLTYYIVDRPAAAINVASTVNLRFIILRLTFSDTSQQLLDIY